MVYEFERHSEWQKYFVDQLANTLIGKVLHDMQAMGPPVRKARVSMIKDTKTNDMKKLTNS